MSCFGARGEGEANYPDRAHFRDAGTGGYSRGATENAGVENAIRPKMQGWKMQEWASRIESRTEIM